jgi:hypothetical protein
MGHRVMVEGIITWDSTTFASMPGAVTIAPQLIPSQS